MFLINYPRELFQVLASGVRYAEIGVYKGSYARGVKRYSPREMYLIDPWVAPSYESLIPDDHLGNAVDTFQSAVSEYYKGGLQSALEEAYPQVQAEFGSLANCTIIRKRSAEAAPDFPDSSLDVIYIDANHRYDFVLADLERWNNKLSDGGYIILNDCYVSPAGKEQHMSVLEAVSTFTKLTNWIAVAAINQDFGDVVLTRRQNIEPAKQFLLQLLISNNIQFVELPSTLIHCMHHKTVSWMVNGKVVSREYMSFGE